MSASYVINAAVIYITEISVQTAQTYCLGLIYLRKISATPAILGIFLKATYKSCTDLKKKI